MKHILFLFLFLTGCSGCITPGESRVGATTDAYCAETCRMWPGAKTIPIEGETCDCATGRMERKP